MKPKLKKTRDTQNSTDNLSRLLTSPRSTARSEKTLTSPRESLRLSKTGEKDRLDVGRDGRDRRGEGKDDKHKRAEGRDEDKPLVQIAEKPATPMMDTPRTPPKKQTLISPSLISQPSPLTLKVNLLSLLSQNNCRGSDEKDSQQNGDQTEDLGALALQMLQHESDALHLSTEEVDQLLQELREGSDSPPLVFRVLKQVEGMDKPKLTSVLEALKQIEGFWELALDLAEKHLFKYQVSVVHCFISESFAELACGSLREPCFP